MDAGVVGTCIMSEGPVSTCVHVAQWFASFTSPPLRTPLASAGCLHLPAGAMNERLPNFQRVYEHELQVLLRTYSIPCLSTRCGQGLLGLSSCGASR